MTNGGDFIKLCFVEYSVIETLNKIAYNKSKKLTANENVFLRNLRSNLTKMDMQEVFEAYRKYVLLEKVNVYLDRVLDAQTGQF